MNGVEEPIKSAGFVFKPSLQDISLKRLRMRYSTGDDCYYLHWDDAVCVPLARFTGLANGVYSNRRIERYCDKETEMYFLGTKNNVNAAQISWKFDFRECGLAVRDFRLKGRCLDDEDIEWRVIGDGEVGCRPMLGVTDDYIDIPEVYGCRYVTVTAVMYSRPDKEPLQLLLGEKGSDCPLDVKVDLMCHREQEKSYIGEILLGLKWSPPSNEDRDDCYHDNHSSGQLQVYIVEGAGLVDEETGRPFNAFIKCKLLPEGSKQHTSPRMTAFPIWAQQFHFHNLDRYDITHGGLELLLCDSHLLYNSNIAGLRLCQPQKVERQLDVAGDDDLACASRSASPSPSSILTFSDASEDGADSPTHPLHLHHSSPSPLSCLAVPAPSSTYAKRSKSLTAPKISGAKIARGHAVSFNSGGQVSVIQRSITPTPCGSSPHILSPTFLRRTRSPSPSLRSPRSIAKTIFRLSGSHLHDFRDLSPSLSPVFPRKKGKSHHRSSEDSEFLYAWMEEVRSHEVTHWKKMIDCEGEWVYSWHPLTPKLKPASG